MKYNVLPKDKRDCPHCGRKESLAYYMEGSKGDLYFCSNGYHISYWNGEKVDKTDGEAYPFRDKSKDKTL